MSCDTRKVDVRDGETDKARAEAADQLDPEDEGEDVAAPAPTYDVADAASVSSEVRTGRFPRDLVCCGPGSKTPS